MMPKWRDVSDVKYEGCQICGCMVCLAAEAGEDVDAHGYVTASGNLYCAPCFAAIKRAEEEKAAAARTGGAGRPQSDKTGAAL